MDLRQKQMLQITQLIKSAKKKLKESSSDMIIANDIGTSRYKKNPQNNQIIIVDSKKILFQVG